MKVIPYACLNFRLSTIFLAIIPALIVTGFNAYAATSKQHNEGTIVQSRRLFDFVYSLPAEKRIDSATAIFKHKCRKMPAATAMADLDQLSVIAIKLGDKALQCAVFWLRADYYSVNNAFNPRSVGYHQQAIDFAKKNLLTLQTALSVHKLGMYYFTFKRYATAYTFFLNAQDLFKAIGYSNVPGISYYLDDMAVFYYDVGDYYNAKIQLALALRYNAYSKRSEINIINTIGLIYRRYRQYPEALSYFNKSLRLAVLTRDSAWIGIAGGNIGSIYFEQNNYGKALPLIRNDYVLSIKYNEDINAAIAMLRLAQISMFRNQSALATAQLDTVKKLIGPASGLWEQWIDYNALRARISQGMGDLSAALAYQKKLEAAKDSLSLRNNLSEFEMMSLRGLMDSHVAQVNRLKTDQSVGYIERNAIIVVLILLVVIFVLIYNRQLLKEKKDKDLIVAEKKIVDERLKNSESELWLYTESLKKQNKLIEKFKTKIQHLDETLADATIVEKLIELNLMTDENWSGFKRLFLKVHPGFFVDQKVLFPNLTETDMKLLTLMKLGLNNTEMANMLGITGEGIKKARQRLRKKMTIADQEGMD